MLHLIDDAAYAHKKTLHEARLFLYSFVNAIKQVLHFLRLDLFHHSQHQM